MVSNIVHERPGVYSSYDASMVINGSKAAKTVGIAAVAASGTVNKPALLTSYAEGISAFGEDAAGVCGMSSLLRALYKNGASAVYAVAVEMIDGAADYAAAFAALEEEKIDIVICDSAEADVHALLKQSVERASGARMERVGVVGAQGKSVEQLIEHAAALNSERMVLIAPDVLDENGVRMSGALGAAAAAGIIASMSDAATPINGVALSGLTGVSERYNDTQIDLLVRGGVTPLEAMGGAVSAVRAVTTRTMSGEAADATWRELTTILIVDDVIPGIRDALKSRFVRTKNNAQSRGAIRSQIIIELENKLAAEIIDGYGEVTVSADAEDPTVCVCEFSFAVAHGLNRIYLSAHITI